MKREQVKRFTVFWKFQEKCIWFSMTAYVPMCTERVGAEANISQKHPFKRIRADRDE